MKTICLVLGISAILIIGIFPLALADTLPEKEVTRGGARISDSLLRWISQLFEESIDEQAETIFSYI